VAGDVIQRKTAAAEDVSDGRINSRDLLHIDRTHQGLLATRTLLAVLAAPGRSLSNLISLHLTRRSLSGLPVQSAYSWSENAYARNYIPAVAAASFTESCVRRPPRLKHCTASPSRTLNKFTDGQCRRLRSDVT